MQLYAHHHMLLVTRKLHTCVCCTAVAVLRISELECNSACAQSSSHMSTVCARASLLMSAC
jgi:hypothetical protein